MKHWQTILVRVLWSIAGAALIVLFVIAWKAKEKKKYNSIQIELVGENTAALFMDEKEILQNLLLTDKRVWFVFVTFNPYFFNLIKRTFKNKIKRLPHEYFY